MEHWWNDADRGKLSMEHWWNDTDRGKLSMEHCWNDTDRGKLSLEHWWNDTDRGELSMEHWWNDTDRGNRSIGKKKVVPLCPPQISHGPTGDLFLFSLSLLYLCCFFLIVLALPFVLCNAHDTNIHAPDGIRTRNPSKRAAADPRLRPLGHRGSNSGLRGERPLSNGPCHGGTYSYQCA